MKSQHTLNRKIVAMSLLCASAAACAAPEQASEDEEIFEQMAALGFAKGDVEIEGDVVRAEGDIVYSREDLLNGVYTSDEGDADGDVEKGYRYSKLVTAANAKKIKLVMATGTYAPSTRVKDAFVKAAASWSNLPLSVVKISTANVGPTITIKMLDQTKWPGVSGCGANDLACALPPKNGKPGAEIWIVSGLGTLEPCELSGTFLQHVAAHELGHTIGFAHPKEAGSTHVSGTMSCGGNSAACDLDPGYDTVMNVNESWYAWPDCSSTGPWEPTADDRATIATVY